MRIKKIVVKPLIILLTTSQCMTAFAGAWTSQSPAEWRYQNDDGTYQSEGWFQDPTDGKLYFLDREGLLVSGWRFIDGTWYYFNSVHDGTFGAAFTNSWYWIDGYCYYFDHAGKMYATTSTPDGFNVDENGRWIENGAAVFVQGKGIQSSSKSSGEPQKSGKHISSGGGGGSGGGSGSSTNVYFNYTVYYVNEDGDVLASETGEARKNSFIEINVKEFEGYEYVGGAGGKQKLLSNNSVYTLKYQEKEALVPQEPEESKVCHYTVEYIDSKSGTLIRSFSATGVRGTQITIPDTSIIGYNADEGNSYSFLLSENRMTWTLYYTQEAELCEYLIQYIGSDGRQLARIEGTAIKGAEIKIPAREFNGYTCSEEAKTNFKVIRDHQVIRVIYEKDIGEDVATPSEPEEKSYSYTVQYIDRDTGDLILKEEGTALAGAIITPDQMLDDYEYALDYSFELEQDADVFIVYIIKNVEELPPDEIEYTVTCIDEEGNTLKVYSGNVSIAGEDVLIRPEYVIPGYTLIGENEFTVTRDGQNAFVLEYCRDKELFNFTIVCIDINSMETISTITLKGEVGEELDVSSIGPQEYKIAGNPPERVVISANPFNNNLKMYFCKIEDTPDKEKQSAYTIQFRAHGDKEKTIITDITGFAPVGEALPVYFTEEVTTSDGWLWKAIDDSPRIFNVKDQKMNTFLIEYMNMGNNEEEDLEQIYTIRYIAEDTLSVLGISTGIATVGETIPYFNMFEEYGFSDNTTSYTVANSGNDVEVILKRVKFPGHEPNSSTGKYNGCEWSVIFVDEEGNQLLPSENGFTVDGDLLYIDYPDTIENISTIYRAEQTGPVENVIEGTGYRQFTIQYYTGESSKNKLENWKEKAQKKKDEFYGTTPYEFYIAYRERNSWNDVGLKLGVAPAGSEVDLEKGKIDGWSATEEVLGSFKLKTAGQSQIVQYERSDGGSSTGFLKRKYQINFEDDDGNELFSAYSGNLAFKEGNSTFEFTVYYPDSFYDAQGNRFVAVDHSPTKFSMSALTENKKTVRYRKVFENEGNQFIVAGNTDVNRILQELASYTCDSNRHEFYLIGKEYDPHTAEVSDTLYANRLSKYVNEVADTFTLDGVSYTVVLLGYEREWAPETCIHEWIYAEELTGNCLTAETRIIKCEKCGKEKTVVYPAMGHVDKNHDSLCDECGVRLNQNLGDEITVTWNSGSLGYGNLNYNFVCIDTDYNGSGKMLYLCEDTLSSDIYGVYTNAAGADYDSSTLKYFLDDRFADGLTVLNALEDIDGSAVSMLSLKEYEAYKAASTNQYPFPSGITLTKGNNAAMVMLSDGTQVTKEEANHYPVRPVILMAPSQEDEIIRTGVWHEGDYQAKEIGDKLYLFRCVDENYQDLTHPDKSLALFLCDTVIPANEGLGFTDQNQTQATRTFGDSNNYKYSEVNTWLSENNSQSGNLVMRNIGIQNEYSGSTSRGKFQNLNNQDLIKHRRDKAQVLHSRLFIPSVEEALSMKKYLWRFYGSDINNPEAVTNIYCDAYWLRTPEYGTDDQVYVVNLNDGTIEPRQVNAVETNGFSSTGIRPLYLVEQAY